MIELKALVNIATHKARYHSLPYTLQSINEADWTGISKTINVYDNDNSINYGAKAKFISQPDKYYDYYFTIDDDLVYHEDYFKHLISKVEEKKRKAVVGVHASIYRKYPVANYYHDQQVIHFSHTMYRDRFVTMLGTGTMCFHKSLFEDVNLFESIRYNNAVDPEFMRICIERKIARLCVKRPAVFVREIQGTQDNAIWKKAANNCKLQTEIVNSIGKTLIQVKKV